jgi:hypothetical protein
MVFNKRRTKELVKKLDLALDPKCVADFIEFAGYTEAELWCIVDKLFNREIFEKMF